MARDGDPRLCSECPTLIAKVNVVEERTQNIKESVDNLFKAVIQHNNVNRAEHEEFRRGIADLVGWRKWVLGISVGVSSVTSAIVVILGFILQVGAWPVSVHPSEAEASEALDTCPASIVESADLLETPATPPPNEEAGSKDESVKLD